MPSPGVVAPKLDGSPDHASVFRSTLALTSWLLPSNALRITQNLVRSIQKPAVLKLAPSPTPIDRDKAGISLARSSL